MTMDTKTYTSLELEKLHTVLYEILGEIARVCKQLDIPFFMIGGSAIGVYYWNGIIPFDDDIDIGMTRRNYERFLRMAPKILDKKFFLQSYESEPHTPFYFAKVRKNGTLFVEQNTKDLNIHQGIFVDIIPFDKIPDNKFMERMHWKLANFIYEIISYKEQPSKDNVHPKIDKLVSRCIPKNHLVRLLKFVQTLFNDSNKHDYNNVMIHNDHIPVEDLEKIQVAKFGNIEVFVPNNLEGYLHRHYPNLRKNLSEEEIRKYTHAPLELSF